MKCRQYNVKVFEIGLEDSEAFLRFLEANRALLGNHLLSIHGAMDEKVLGYLEEHGFHYVFNMNLPRARKAVEKFRLLISDEEGSVPGEVIEALESIRRLQDREANEAVAAPGIENPETECKSTDTADTVESDREEQYEAPLRIVRQPLRSGQVVEHDGSVLLTERINSGAKVSALGSVIALGPVEGDISSVGECVIVPSIHRGTLLFHGHKIEPEILKHRLNRISFVGDQILVQPINKKEFH